MKNLFVTIAVTALIAVACGPKKSKDHSTFNNPKHVLTGAFTVNVDETYVENGGTPATLSFPFIGDISQQGPAIGYFVWTALADDSDITINLSGTQNDQDQDLVPFGIWWSNDVDGTIQEDGTGHVEEHFVMFNLTGEVACDGMSPGTCHQDYTYDFSNLVAVVH